MPKHKDITYDLKRTKRKTASIYVERDGGVSVLVPEELSDQDVKDLLESKRKWIYQNLAEWEDLNAARVQRDFVNGEGFLYLGRSYRLRIVDQQDQPLILKDGYFCLRADHRAKADVEFRAFYRDKGRQRLTERVQQYKDRIGVNPGTVRVMELKNRWASCSTDGALNFHWKCMMAPLRIIDYIVVHELTHLLHPRHTQAFWNQLDKILPDYQERRDWLRQNGAGMSL